MRLDPTQQDPGLLMEDETSLPWETWATEFAEKMPEVIKKMEAELFAESVQNLDNEIKDRIGNGSLQCRFQDSTNQKMEKLKSMRPTIV